MNEITYKTIESFNKNLKNIPNYETIQRAVMNNGINKSCENYAYIAKNLNRTFSIDIDTGKVTDQKHSGRCWLFATLNTLRYEVSVDYKIRDFEFSENYLSFWDRFEKANAFLNFIIDTAKEPVDSRLIHTLFELSTSDGGQWHNAFALIEKYGAVPKYVMAETSASNNTAEFDQVLNLKLRKDAMILRDMISDNAPEEFIKQILEEMLNEVYRICVYSFGTPPTTFDFEYRDNDRVYHKDLGLTPKEFAKKYIKRNLNDYVVIINSPEKEFNKLYSMPLEDNVIGGPNVQYINLELNTFKNLILSQLKDGEPTWFGCDVLQEMDRQKGYLGADLFNYEDLFEINLNMSKADRLLYSEAVSSHAMTMTGVDLIDNKPVRWKAENSWSDKVGEKGYFVMDDNWFDEYVYQIVINKKYLTKEQLAILDTKPVELPLWDSMS